MMTTVTISVPTMMQTAHLDRSLARNANHLPQLLLCSTKKCANPIMDSCEKNMTDYSAAFFNLLMVLVIRRDT